jgi:hypothetical protein
LRAILLLPVLLILARGDSARGDSAAETPAPPPPTLRASVDTSATTVGGSIHLTVEVDRSPGWLVDPPTRDLDLEPFRVRAVERRPRPDGEAFRLRIVPLNAGEIDIPPVTLTAHGSGGAKEEIATPPIPVTVASNLPPPAPPPEAAAEEDGEEDGGAGGGEQDAAPPDRADYKPARTVSRDWIPLILAAAALVAAALLGYSLLRRWRRRRGRRAEEDPAAPRKPLRPAWEIALEELDRIVGAGYVDRGEVDLQYVEVTEALRRYLEDRYGVPALESTTEELRGHLRPSPVPDPVQSRILAVLREADLVKFARAVPESTEARSVEQRARELVHATMPRPARKAVP